MGDGSIKEKGKKQQFIEAKLRICGERSHKKPNTQYLELSFAPASPFRNALNFSLFWKKENPNNKAWVLMMKRMSI